MPVRFALTPRIDPANGPMALQHIDDGIAEYLGVPSDPEHWCFGWYDVIGFRLALGQTWQQIDAHLFDNLRRSFQSDNPAYLQSAARRVLISRFLQDNYLTGSWWESKS